MGPCDLENIILGLPTFDDPRILAGKNYTDDAGIFRLNDNTMIVQTLDFFPPVVNDPYLFGQISAANSMSDIYAMGAIPVTALNIVGFPSKVDRIILREILRGGIDKVREAGAVVLGGHTVIDREIKYGLAVTGIVKNNSFTRNSGARAGDLLILTKPLGMGIITTGIKKGITPGDVEQEAVKWMSRLNKNASEAMMKAGANSATDITGFGLLGHALRMAEASDVTIKLEVKKIPVIEGTRDILEKGAYPGGSGRNRQYIEKSIKWNDRIDEPARKIMVDAQTSGGLFISISSEKADDLLQNLRDGGDEYSEVIGEVIPKGDKFIEVA
ncbi:MAG: selenide, water dikinase SelD [Candidatus Eremiobacteraeota bacterium]|nr:selenide, water dikinase SelD [Candidatus Eremiobacteraeota bacterium]